MPSFCVHCGAPLKQGVRFCTACGKPVPAARPDSAAPQPEVPSVCPQCGRPLKAGARFCTGCGYRLPAQPAPQPPQPQTRQQPAQPQPAQPQPVQPRPVQPQPAQQQPAPRQNAVYAGTAAFGQHPSGRPPVGAQHSVVCPRCGRLIPPGKTICDTCGARILQNEPPVPDEPDDEEDETLIRAQRRRTGMWITISAVAAVIVAAAVLLLIFWDDLFGKKSSTDDTVIFGEATMTATASASTTEPVESTGTPTEAPSTETAEATQPATEPSTEPAAESTQRRLSSDEAITIVRSFYGGDCRILSETADTFTVGVYKEGTDILCGIIGVDRKTGERSVIAEVDFSAAETEPETEPSDTAWTGPEEGPGFEGNTDPDRGPVEACNVEDVNQDAVIYELEEAIPGASYTFTVLDLYNGAYCGTDTQGDPMSSSVLIGIPVLYAVNQEILDGNLTMESELSVVSGKSSRGSLIGVKTMTVADLLDAMLRKSSGDAICTLIHAIGKDRINGICADHGYWSVDVNNYIGETVDYDPDSDNFVSTCDLCRMMFELYCGEETADINRQYLLDHFGITEGSYLNDGLGKYVDGVVGAFNGVKSDKFNEIILVERGGRAYVMALMANGASVSDILNGMSGVGEYVDRVIGN